MLPIVILVVAAFCCTLCALFYPNRPAAGPWYGNLHLGWLGVALYLWSLVFFHGR